MATERTFREINERIKQGKAVVITAEELVTLVKEKGVSYATSEVDVVTTGTFGPMCSSGAFLNLGHSKPRIKMQKVWLNGVPAYSGIAAVDAYIGATEVREDDPLNSDYPGEFRYGGGHVIQDLVAGKKVTLRTTGYGTDCYPRREYEAQITLDDINEAILFNPRNAYQNYSCAVNPSSRTIHTYMGVLKSNMQNAHYSTSGQLSPLLKDPWFKTIGIGTRIFLGGSVGYVAWNGTQHFPSFMKDENGQDVSAAGATLSVIGDLKKMSPRWLAGASMLGYGASLSVGLGIPIPILNEDVCRFAAVGDDELFAPIVDYSQAFPEREPGNLGMVSYAELKSGTIKINGREVTTAPMSSYPRAREIAGLLKTWIQKGEFLLGEPVELLPDANAGINANALQG